MGAHPGWAIRFEDGTWLGGAHGYTRTVNAFDAHIYSSKENAEKILNYLKNNKDVGAHFSFPSQIIEAWEPVCKTLRSEVKALKAANVISYLDIFELREELESIVNKVKGWQEKGKQTQSNVNWEGLAKLLGCNANEVATKVLALDHRSDPKSTNVSNTNGDFNDH